VVSSDSVSVRMEKENMEIENMESIKTVLSENEYIDEGLVWKKGGDEGVLVAGTIDRLIRKLADPNAQGLWIVLAIVFSILLF